jgi:hypothetical protein
MIGLEKSVIKRTYPVGYQRQTVFIAHITSKTHFDTPADTFAAAK